MAVKYHPDGLCYVRDGHVFVPIPKCASTSVKDALVSKKWERTLRVPGEAFAVVRDPVDRYFAGVWQYAHRYHHDYNELLDKVERDGVRCFDEHTVPQTHFLEPWWPNVELVPIDDVSRFMLDRFGIQIGEKNPGEWTPRLSLVDAIRGYYSADVEMWERVCSGRS